MSLKFWDDAASFFHSPVLTKKIERKISQKSQWNRHEYKRNPLQSKVKHIFGRTVGHFCTKKESGHFRYGAWIPSWNFNFWDSSVVKFYVDIDYRNRNLRNDTLQNR